MNDKSIELQFWSVICGVLSIASFFFFLSLQASGIEDLDGVRMALFLWIFGPIILGILGTLLYLMQSNKSTKIGLILSLMGIIVTVFFWIYMYMN